MSTSVGDETSLYTAPKRWWEGTHRVVSPAITVSLLQGLLRPLGITRVADVTGLDKVGIPTVMVIRPNARSISVSQGKGRTQALARASGLMESLELYCAERCALQLRLASARELALEAPIIDLGRLPRPADSRFTSHRALLWAQGRLLGDESPVFVPYEMIHADYRIPVPTGSGCFHTTTNGLASGNHPLEAICHALCEVIERDAVTLWKFSNPERQAACRLDPTTVDDPLCRELFLRFEVAGLFCAVWEVTSDVGVAAFYAIVSNKSPTMLLGGFSAAGAGCHPAREVALSRALTEAAQSRVARISGSRDDLTRRGYEQARDKETLAASNAVLSAAPARRFEDAPTFASRSLDEDVAWLSGRLTKASFQEIAVVDLTLPQVGIPVFRAIVPGLELSHETPGYLPRHRARGVQ